MADPLSIITGAARLISLATAILGKCYHCGCVVAGAPEEARQLATEVSTLIGVLLNLQTIAQSTTAFPRSDYIANLISSCDNALQEISTLLDTAVSISDQWMMKQSIKRLVWPLKQKQTAEILAKVKQQKSTDKSQH